MKAILDPDVGEEVVLYLRDQTPFMDDLRRIRPFRLMLKAGAGRNEFGPLCFMLFWIPSPADPEASFAAYDVYFNPHNDVQLATWRELAAQSHWHLFLIGTGGQQRDFFEFENTFNLDNTLNFMTEACGPIQLVDFNRAKTKFMQENSVDDLFTMQSTNGTLNTKPPGFFFADRHRTFRPATTSQPTCSPDAFFLAHLGEWLVVTLDEHFPRFPEIKPHGTHALVFLYNDHAKGLALRVEAFIVFSSDGYPRITRHVLIDDGRLFIKIIGLKPRPSGRLWFV
ncbi:MAG: hypothetical protein WCQ21_20285, partial [Verrucomicrobiota bacterium]